MLVRIKGVEPPRLSTIEPKSIAYANFATLAKPSPGESASQIPNAQIGRQMKCVILAGEQADVCPGKIGQDLHDVVRPLSGVFYIISRRHEKINPFTESVRKSLSLGY